MTVYVFGNVDVKNDSAAIEAAKKISGISFKIIKPNEDVNFDTKHPVILDVVKNLDKVTVFDNLKDLSLAKSVTVHDFDLGFQLKYLKKIGVISGATIVGLPTDKKPSYRRIKLILRKLVAQDMQGS